MTEVRKAHCRADSHAAVYIHQKGFVVLKSLVPHFEGTKNFSDVGCDSEVI